MGTPKTKQTFSVLFYDAKNSGPAGDHTHIKRFLRRADADAFAVGKTCYGQPAIAQEEEVSIAVFKRWQREGKI